VINIPWGARLAGAPRTSPLVNWLNGGNLLAKVLPILLTVLLLFTTGCHLSYPQGELTGDKQQRMQLVGEIKAFQRELGFDESGNFKTSSDETEAYDYFFYTPNTALPHSLDDPLLQSSIGKPEHFDLEGYDVFFYSIQAIADVETPVTRSLMRAPLSRFIHIIFHEDWHEQIDLPLGIEEPSGEIVSYNAALLFAEKKFGRDSAVYRMLKEEYSNKLRGSIVYQQYYDELSGVYARYHSGEITEERAFSHKAELIESMGHELRDIWSARPDQLNNAFIAFQMTYFRHFPLMHQVFASTGFDLPKTIAIFRAMPKQGASFETVEDVKNIETEVTNYLRETHQQISRVDRTLPMPDHGKIIKIEEKTVKLAELVGHRHYGKS